jgi:transformation/transcription domain-associated protein
MLGKLRLGLF